jgi:predicted GIY-YIG superfamily endonuclease
MKGDWCVYVIECASGAYYTGSTTDLAKRFELHKAGKGAKYMRMDRPKRIVAARTCVSKGKALKLEAAIKQLSRKGKRGWVDANPYTAPRS